MTCSALTPAATAITEAAPFTSEEMEAAYRSMRSAIDALAVEECPAITTDIDAAAATVLAAAPRVAMYEPQLRVLPGIMASVERLRPYALGVMYAQVQLRLTDKLSPSPKALEELVAVRELMLADLTPLVRRGLVSDDFLTELNPASGYRNVANDVLLLAAVADRHWPSISGRTALTAASIGEARDKATNMLSALVSREGRSRSVDPTGERLRAFTLMTRAYDDARRGITFLLWGRGDDAIDAVAPSLFRGRGGRGGKKDEPVVVSGPAIDPDKPVRDPNSPFIDG